MAVYFGRFCEVRVGARGVSGLRTRFTVTRTVGPKPDTARIDVWNLSADTRAAWQSEKSVPVLLRAGYQDAPSDIVLGDSRLIGSTKEGVDWITTITLGDGERAAAKARVNTTIPKGSSAHKALDRVLASLDEEGVNTSQAQKQMASKDFRGALKTLSKAKAVTGSSFKELQNLVEGLDSDIAVQDNTLIVAATGELAQTRNIPLITQGSGLIGSPEAGEGGRITLTTLLDPRLRPLHGLELQSGSFDGVYKATKVVYKGDTHGRDWYSRVEAVPL